VLRNVDGDILSNQNVSLRFTIRMASANGPVEWQETQATTTSAIGLVNLQMGNVNALNNVNWAAGDKFLQVELNVGNGFIDLGTQAMLSVPYALYAVNGIERVSDVGDTLFLSNGNTIIIPGISNTTGEGAGCIFPDACNYNANATSDDGSCQFIGDACNDGNASTTGDQWTIDCVCTGSLSVIGATSTCGAPNVHNPELVYGTLTDQQGNVYRTIQIGLQEWMAENLKTTIYRNGDAIPTNLNNSEWGATTEGAWAFAGGGSSLLCPFSRLYNGWAVSDERGICPLGWHVPNASEFNFLSLSVSQLFSVNSSVARSLRSSGNLFWNNPESGDNDSGFSALAAGMRNSGGVSTQLLECAYFWISTSDVNNIKGYATIHNYSATLEVGGNANNFHGFSIRCVRD
jgi:uncharacterized protein (TIGR02145 family)